jgi:hypothetical protein
LKLALEALDAWMPTWPNLIEKQKTAITAIKQALAAPVQDSTCNNSLREQGKAYPRTCRKCGFGPCIALANIALDKKAENARELGLDYEPDLQAELDATNRQVEILSDALAESRREVAALKAVQEPVAWEDVLGAIARGWTHPENAQKPMDVQLAVAIAKEIQDMYTTPPAAQRQHLTDGSLCWCEPETSYTDPETGASVVVHKGPQ